MLDLAALAASAVALITPLLAKAVEKGVEEVGKTTAGSLLGALKARLTHSGAKAALADLSQTPTDTDAQGQLRMQLRKALTEDATLADFLKEWLAEGEKLAPAVSQNAHTVGDQNTTIQVAGSGNQIGKV